MNENDIEYINALAPFDHGIWQGSSSSGRNISVGEGSLFSERATWLVDKIISYLTNNFSEQDLEGMSVLEVGSYDGWVLTQICKKIKFSKVLGVEARMKNIRKGEVGRHLANIHTQARFIKGNVSDLNSLLQNQTFDIVICLGMLHHVSSTFDTISMLCDKALKMVIIDSMIIPELESDKEIIEPYVNTKDIVYYGEKKTWTVGAFKLESPYGDGSRPNFGIVNVPSACLIEMSLSSCGFGRLIKLGSELDFYNESKQNLRGVKELLLVGQRDVGRESLDGQWREKIQNSENIFCHYTLPEELILAMSKVFLDFKELNILQQVELVTGENHNQDIENLVSAVISSGLTENLKIRLLENIDGIEAVHFDILAVIFRSPFEKIIFEISKFFLKKQLPLLTIQYLQLVVSRPGCDWWVFYRSCYILRQAFQAVDDKVQSQHYQDLLSLSNENFPF
jgi:2-polyprenyl-3-methyl-5-hydroxy-6-metoxy-1,4-benzoquinol methylase